MITDKEKESLKPVIEMKKEEAARRIKDAVERNEPMEQDLYNLCILNRMEEKLDGR